MNNDILYIGGFQLPDKNAAAQRVTGIAKGLRSIGYNVIFLNSLKNSDDIGINNKEYYGFECYEYQRETNLDYMVSAKTCISMIKKIQPHAVIAYNYPAISLNMVVRYCHKNGIICFADATEWYDATGRNLVFRFIKWLDTILRMKYVHKKMDGIIAISKYLYNYYRHSVNTVLIPPTVDMEDEKWHISVEKKQEGVSFVYAGAPSVSKERLDRIVLAAGVVEQEEKICLNIVGITKEQFIDLYDWKASIPKSIIFWGRVEHKQAIQIVRQSDWTIILRENSRMVKAGFPTKLVESISCGIPVLANRFSDVFDYLTYKNSICVEDLDYIEDNMIQACKRKCKIDSNVFDYHNYLQELDKLITD